MTSRAVASATWLLLALEAPLAAQIGAPAGAARPAEAAPGAPSAPDSAALASGRPGLVEMTVVGPVADYERLIAPIGARTPSGVPLLWNRIDRFNPLAELLRADPPLSWVALRCWIDLSDLRRVRLYFASRGGERFLVRELALSGRLDEVDQQSLAQVLEISIAALIENQDSGLTRAEAREVLARSQPEPEPPPLVQPALARRWRLAAAASYGIAAVAASMPMGQGPGVTLSLLARRAAVTPAPDAAFAARAGFWIAGHYRIPVTARAPEIGVRLETLAARAGVAGGWGRVSARLGAGLDWVHVTPLAGSTGAATQLAAPHWSATWVLSGAVAARLPIDRVAAALSGVALSLVLSIETLPVPTEYAVADGSGARVPFALRRTRPGLALELGF